ncbi:DUF456 domain-containing protein [Streptomyces sp. J2-1]|uniref:DUF456 domain-containing protein n=1 Tax=Streptomyces corallincola TaxID=2851888 RepID=UPI001C393FF0|nr:DUF456 domain-containing protein [Streptomyces corallincola]MBV2354300.1 DUF456 domain-containing protein [Streptomyces corallincola]
MGPWELGLVGVIIALGLGGVLVPGVPGSWLVWAGVLWWALSDPRPLAWTVLVGATLVLLLSLAVRTALPARRFRQSGTPQDTVAYAGVGGAVGFVVLPVLGALPGFLAGIYLHERLRLGGHGEATAALRTAMRSGGSAVFAEFFACLLIAGAWLGAVVWG